MRIWSDAPVSLVQLPPLRRIELRGMWSEREDDADGGSEPAATGMGEVARGDSAPAVGRTDGGRWPALTWALNPQYALCAAAGGSAMIVAERLDDDANAGGADDEEGTFSTAALTAESGEAAAPPEPTGEELAALEAAARAAAKAALEAPLDPSGAIGVRVVRPSINGGAAAAAAPPVDGVLRVSAGLSGNVRDRASGALLQTRRHTALDMTEDDLNLYGIRGKPRPAAKKAPPKPKTGSGGVAAGEEADALAAASEAAGRVTRAVASLADDTVAEFGFTSESLASGVVDVDAGDPLLLVASLASSGRGGRFRLTALTDVPAALTPVAGRSHVASISGEWRGSAGAPKAGPSGGVAPAAKRGGNAGGCHMEPTWGLNPQYLLTISAGSDVHRPIGSPCSLKIALRRPAEPWATPMQRNPVESMAGFYLIRAPAPLVDAPAGSKTKLPLRSKADLDIVHESCFSPTLEADCTLELILRAEPTSLVLVPATYGPGQMGPFSIELACDVPLEWLALP